MHTRDPTQQVLGQGDLLGCILQHCRDDAATLAAVRAVCNAWRDACDALLYSVDARVMQEVLLLGPHGYKKCFVKAMAALSAWAARFLQQSAALTLGLVCTQPAPSIHPEYTVRLNRAVLDAARGLERLSLHLPDVLGPSLNRLVAPMRGLTQLSLALVDLDQGDYVKQEAFFSLSCHALGRALRPLTALKAVSLDWPPHQDFMLEKVACSLPPSLTALSIRLGTQPAGATPQGTGAACQLRHLTALQHLELVGVLSEDYANQALPATLSTLTRLRIAHNVGLSLNPDWAPAELPGLAASLAALPHLVHLEATEGVLDAWPAALAPSLSHLDLRRNPVLQFAAPPAGLLAGLTNLQHLALGTAVEAPLLPLPDLSALAPTLRHLEATSCSLEGQAEGEGGDDGSLSPLRRLTSLRLHNCPLGEGLCLFLMGMPALQELQLVRCGLPAVPWGLELLEGLTSLDLRCNPFGNRAELDLQGMVQLREVHPGSCRVVSLPPAGRGCLPAHVRWRLEARPGSWGQQQQDNDEDEGEEDVEGLPALLTPLLFDEVWVDEWDDASSWDGVLSEEEWGQQEYESMRGAAWAYF